MKVMNAVGVVFGLAAGAMGCTSEYEAVSEPAWDVHEDHPRVDDERIDDDLVVQSTGLIDVHPTEMIHGLETRLESVNDPLCSGNLISAEGVQQMLVLTEVTDHEDIYSTYDRIDGIASLFEQCGDPWGLFPTTYRHITRRIIRAIEDREIDDQEWGRRIVLDFAGRYLANLQAALTQEEPSWAWKQYYYLADRDDVSRTRAVVVAMVAHLTLDLPHSLVAVDSTEDHEDDYFVLGELMIEITDDFIADLDEYYDTDAGDLLNGFFIGDWVDGAFGEDTTITLNYQTIRTKSWNNRWLLEQWWGGWIADSEIYAAFWAIDGVLAALDAAGTI